MEISVLLEAQLTIPSNLGGTHIESFVRDELEKDMKIYSQKMSDKVVKLIKNRTRFDFYKEKI